VDLNALAVLEERDAVALKANESRLRINENGYLAASRHDPQRAGPKGLHYDFAAKSNRLATAACHPRTTRRVIQAMKRVLL